MNNGADLEEDHILGSYDHLTCGFDTIGPKFQPPRPRQLSRGNPVRQVDTESTYPRAEIEYKKYQSEIEVKQVAYHVTTLGKLGVADFDRVSRHGYEVAQATLEGYASSILVTD